MKKDRKKYEPKSAIEKKDDYNNQVADFFIKALEEKTAPWMKPWKAVGGGIPHNPETGTKYQGFNQLLLMMHQDLVLSTFDSRWMTFLNARNNGYTVKAGSKGVTIKHYSEVPLDENRKIIPPEQRGVVKPASYIPQVRYFTVFNGSQINGIPQLLEPVLDKVKIHETAQTLLDTSKAVILHDQRDRCFYRPSSDEIHLVPKEQFDSTANYYSTALHELAHWTGHEKRLAREIAHPKGSEQYAKEELRAEIGSFMLCRALEVDFSPQDSAAYVKSWSSNLKDKPEEIFKACYEADTIKNYCLAFTQTREIDHEQKKTVKLSR